jgi:hypothetical protein
MAHFKLNDADEKFLAVPQDGVLVFAGSSGTESFIERERDATVRIVIKAVGAATADDGVLGVTVEVGEAKASGQDGPFPNESTLRASQSVQVMVKAGQRLSFKAYPAATNATVLRTVVSIADMTPRPAGEADAEPQRRSSSLQPADHTDQASANAH